MPLSLEYSSLFLVRYCFDYPASLSLSFSPPLAPPHVYCLSFSALSFVDFCVFHRVGTFFLGTNLLSHVSTYLIWKTRLFHSQFLFMKAVGNDLALCKLSWILNELWNVPLFSVLFPCRNTFWRNPRYKTGSRNWGGGIAARMHSLYWPSESSP